MCSKLKNLGTYYNLINVLIILKTTNMFIIGRIFVLARQVPLNSSHTNVRSIFYQSGVTYFFAISCFAIIVHPKWLYNYCSRNINTYYRLTMQSTENSAPGEQLIKLHGKRFETKRLLIRITKRHLTATRVLSNTVKAEQSRVPL